MGGLTCLHCAGPVSRVPFVLLSLKAQLPLLLNRPKEGVQALHELLQYCQMKPDGEQHASDGKEAAAEGVYNLTPDTWQTEVCSSACSCRWQHRKQDRSCLAPCVLSSASSFCLQRRCSPVWRADVLS